MSIGSLDLSGPAAAAAISAAAAIITEALGRAPSRTQSRDSSNQLAIRTGELARLILESLRREPISATTSSGPAVAVLASPAVTLDATDSEPKCSVGW